jgi:diguanylate cyclase (GGDEF)-like protein
MSNIKQPFEGFGELIQKPFEQTDPDSFAFIRKLLLSLPEADPSPFGFLIRSLSFIVITPREARTHWKKILDHKRRLEMKLGRVIHIKTAVIDYYDQLGVDLAVTPEPGAAPNRHETTGKAEDTAGHRAVGTRSYSPSRLTNAGSSAKMSDSRTGLKSSGESDPLLERMNIPGYHQERLKEEMQRARRYKHALSVIMVRIDLQPLDNSPAPDQTKDKALTVIAKMINKTVRTVDILARHSDDLYLLILPNTNKREAKELAERLKNNIAQRAQRIPELQGGIPICFAVGQCTREDSSTDFINRLENLIAGGSTTDPTSVLSLD